MRALGVHSTIVVGAVADDVPGLTQSAPYLLDRVLRHRVGRVVGQQLEEVAGRVLERDLERLRVDASTPSWSRVPASCPS